MTVKLLLVGDMHLGRAPSRLPEALEDHGVSRLSLGPAAAWAATVQAALERRPHAVVLAGDVVESSNARFEAFPHLLEGVRKLVLAGIRVCGVAGNHDQEALPLLGRHLRGFELLGEDGTWSACALPSGDRPELRVVGWSWPFTRKTHRDRVPTESFPTFPDGGAVIGLAHADLDAGESRYAPVSRAALERTGAAAFFLGHVHRPDPLTGPRPIGYLGSLVGLDPTETGLRGPWWAEVERDGRLALSRLHLAPLRYEQLEARLRPDLDRDDVLGALMGVAERCRDALVEELEGCRALGLRVRLTGEVRDHAAVAAELAAIEARGLVVPLGERAAFLEKLVNDTAPAVDLVAVAEGEDPPGLLARELLALEEGGARCAELVAVLRTRVAGVLAQSWFARHGDAEPSDEEVRRSLLRAGRKALAAMLVRGGKEGAAR